ncbi:MAG: 4a-hydroxytetrahydrobiopterin dehydratase [Leptospiraceae bacterium]|nr:4a-hydroxytetrahydrobiopterin dehydratase [Leptospiraceae bacterium]
MKVYKEAEILEKLKEYKLFQYKNQKLFASFEFPSYKAGLDFVNKVGELAEEMDHHPDIYLGYRKANLEIMTHSAGGITDLDFKFAKRVEEIQ